jgi:hypothetical protein
MIDAVNPVRDDGLQTESSVVPSRRRYLLDIHHLAAEINAVVADVDARTGNQLLNLRLASSAERALAELPALAESRHSWPLLEPSRVRSVLALGVRDCLPPDAQGLASRDVRGSGHP